MRPYDQLKAKYLLFSKANGQKTRQGSDLGLGDDVVRSSDRIVM